MALKAAGILAGMLTLAGIGAASTLAGNGIALTRESPQSPGVWVAQDSADNQGRSPADRHGTSTSNGLATGAAPGTMASATPVSVAPPSAGITADGKIVLNVASAEELQKLPRVGAKRALAIVELRTKLGRFRQTTDLLRVRGIGRKTLRLLTPLLVLDAPDAPTTAAGLPVPKAR